MDESTSIDRQTFDERSRWLFAEGLGALPKQLGGAEQRSFDQQSAGSPPGVPPNLAWKKQEMMTTISGPLR